MMYRFTRHGMSCTAVGFLLCLGSVSGLAQTPVAQRYPTIEGYAASYWVVPVFVTTDFALSNPFPKGATLQTAGLPPGTSPAFPANCKESPPMTDHVHNGCVALVTQHYMQAYVAENLTAAIRTLQSSTEIKSIVEKLVAERTEQLEKEIADLRAELHSKPKVAPRKE
jgi:hypothetical protein